MGWFAGVVFAFCGFGWGELLALFLGFLVLVWFAWVFCLLGGLVGVGHCSGVCALLCIFLVLLLWFDVCVCFGGVMLFGFVFLRFLWVC